MDKRCGKRGLAVAALCLLFTPAVGSNPAAASKQTDAIEQLDEVEVTASRIAPKPHAVPLPTPEISTATRLPPDSPRHGFTPLAPPAAGDRSPRLLKDETAFFPGRRVRYLEVPHPIYPRRAREMGWEGTVLLRLQVRSDGTVGEVEVEQSSGYELLDRTALRAAKTWKFAPQTDGGFAMSALVDVPIRFDLTEPQGSLDLR